MCTVLIVDDEPAILELLVDVLGDEGHTTLSAANGRLALDLLQEHPVDVVVTDTMMPYVSGPDLIQAMRRQRALRHIPVILTSAAPAPDVSGLGLFAFLSKPFELDHLMTTVTAAADLELAP